MNKKIQTKDEKLERKSFQRIKVENPLALPNLVEIQTDSFKKFKETGLEEVFRDVFPITANNGAFTLNLERFFFDEPQFSIQECKDKDRTYACPLNAKFSLTINSTGEILEEEPIYLGSVPEMTSAGTFIINGAERVIVSQLVRCPGAYMDQTKDEKYGCDIYHADFLPSRGIYLQFENDNKKIFYARIDRNKRVGGLTFLKAIGFTSEDLIRKYFGTSYEDPSKVDLSEQVRSILDESLDKDTSFAQDVNENKTRDQIIFAALTDIYKKMKPDEITTDDGIRQYLKQRYFDTKRYDLAKVGRYKLHMKLGLYNRLIDVKLAEDLIDCNGEVIYKKGTRIKKAQRDHLKEIRFFENGGCCESLSFLNKEYDEHDTVQIVKVYSKYDSNKIVTIIGNDLTCDKKGHYNTDDTILTIPDMVALVSYYFNLAEGIGNTDDIDFLGNRRIKTTGELLAGAFRTGLTKMEKNIKDKMSMSNAKEQRVEEEVEGLDEENKTPKAKPLTIKSLGNGKQLFSAIKEFFNSSQLSQFMDQINPLSEITNKRRLSSLGPGGLSRKRASIEVRDVQSSYYGRICPIETPEGQNVGLINNPCTYTRINEYGFLVTPYRKVVDCKVLDEICWLTADEEEDEAYIAEADIKLNEDGTIADDVCLVRYKGEYQNTKKENINYVDVSPRQVVSVATACIPFLEHDDQHRAMMGANMQKQALPLLKPHSPYVGTGLDDVIAHDSGSSVVSGIDGKVTYVDAKRIEITPSKGDKVTYELTKFARSNQATNINQTPIVKLGQSVKKGEIIADGPAMDHGELALGQNVTVAFMTWQGYNFEDAVILSERLVKDDVFTSIHIERYDVECRQVTKLGNEEITRVLPNVKDEKISYLDSEGIVSIGTVVKEGDILVGKVTPKGTSDNDSYAKMLHAIFGDKAKDLKDTSLRVPHGADGIVIGVKRFKRDDPGVELPANVIEKVRVFIAQKRKIGEGDKMAGRHGNKGVISKVLPVEDMPYMEDGTPVDIMLSPLGVPSRMNIGQIFELHWGEAAKKLGYKVSVPVFDSEDKLYDLMDEAGIPRDGKKVLYDGRTGEPFEQKIAVGTMYMLKLSHMVEDKLHARATGPYSVVTQQPIGGKAHNGGQRFGEMEVWALEAYGASNILQEIITIKSDDIAGRARTLDAIYRGKDIPKSGFPESFKVLQKELQALAIDVKLFNQDDEELDMKEISNQEQQETHRINARSKDIREKMDDVVISRDTEEVYSDDE